MATAGKKRPGRKATATDAATAPTAGARHQVVPAGGALVTSGLVLQNETGQPIDVEFLGKSDVKLSGTRAARRRSP